MRFRNSRTCGGRAGGGGLLRFLFFGFCLSLFPAEWRPLGLSTVCSSRYQHSMGLHELPDEVKDVGQATVGESRHGRVGPLSVGRKAEVAPPCSVNYNVCDPTTS